jgi:hypothetical protein
MIQLLVSEAGSSISIGSFVTSRSSVASVYGVSVSGSSATRPVSPISSPCPAWALAAAEVSSGAVEAAPADRPWLLRRRHRRPARAPAAVSPDATGAALVDLPWCLRRRCRRPPLAGPELSTNTAAPESHAGRCGRPPAARAAPEHPEPADHGCLQSHTRCRKPLQRRQRWGSLHVATRCAEERQLRHLSCRSAGMRLRGPTITLLIDMHYTSCTS